MSIAQRLSQLTATVPPGVSLVAVSKFHPAETVRQAYDAGQRIFGESRVQELVAKQPQLPPDIEWHFIGTLQRNKVKYIAPFIHTIHSIDSVELLHEVDRQAARCGRTIRTLIEVHIATEQTKHGFTADECQRLFADGTLTQFKHIRLGGLMGMATFTDDTAQVAREFNSLRQLFDQLRNTGAAPESFAELSMGMSDDYPIAIRCGSTLIRIGTAIFGTRNT